MHRAILSAVIAIAPLACHTIDCPNLGSATAVIVDQDPSGELEACCAVADSPDEVAELCETHPFGRAPGCGGVEEPQTSEACQAVMRENEGVCTSAYVVCRDAIREVTCDVCPPECEDIAGAC